MLSDDNIRKINDQIESEVRDLGSFMTDDEDKPAILDRITKLKALLSPQPTRSDILAELAAALTEAQRNPPPTFADNLIDQIVASFRR